MRKIKWSGLLAGIALLSAAVSHCGTPEITPTVRPRETPTSVSPESNTIAPTPTIDEQPQDLADVKVRFEQGVDYYNQGQFDKAVELFNAILDEDPSHLNARSNLGASYFRKGDLEDALREFQIAHEQAKNDAEILYNLGAVKLAIGDAEAALEDFKAAQKIAPDLPDVHIGMGNVYLMRGEEEAALKELQTALDLAPNAPWRPIIESQIQTLKQKPKATDEN